MTTKFFQPPTHTAKECSTYEQASAKRGFEGQVRFNWGFHDAHADRLHQWGDRRYLTAYNGFQYPLPADRYYASGYDAGMRSECEHPACTSESAWAEFKGREVR